MVLVGLSAGKGFTFAWMGGNAAAVLVMGLLGRLGALDMRAIGKGSVVRLGAVVYSAWKVREMAVIVHMVAIVMKGWVVVLMVLLYMVALGVRLSAGMVQLTVLI